MPNKQSENWSDEHQLLLRWNGRARVLTIAGETECEMTLEAIFHVRGTHPTRRGFDLVRFGLNGASVQVLNLSTGVIAVTGRDAQGSLTLDGAEPSIHIHAGASLYYEGLSRINPLTREYELGDRLSTRLRIDAVIAEKANAPVLEKGRIHIFAGDNKDSHIQAIQIDLKKVRLFPYIPSRIVYRPFPPGPRPDVPDLDVLGFRISVPRRQLRIQPVLVTRTGDPHIPRTTAGTTVTSQITKARDIWRKACVELVDLPPVSRNAANGDSLFTILNSYNFASVPPDAAADSKVVEVFFVRHPVLLMTGGASTTHYDGDLTAKVMVYDSNAAAGDPVTNSVLLAHEIGHVFGLAHPDDGIPPLDIKTEDSMIEPGTIMAPSGSPFVNGNELVTFYMAERVKTNPHLEPAAGGGRCDLTHDIADHYIRSFPSDTGAEPGTPLPGENFYSMSNAWNSLNLNDPGPLPNSTTPPVHQQPVRGLPGSPQTNYLRAYVEQRNGIIKVHDAKVRFYWVVPGAGGGAATLTPLEEFPSTIPPKTEIPVPNTLAVGHPELVSMAWQVPTGMIGHSCIFASVYSPAEPEDVATVANISQLVTEDNDWVQRNLEIQTVFPMIRNRRIRLESSPFRIQIGPKKEGRSSQLTLEVDARRAEGLENLKVEVIGLKTISGKPGKISRHTIDLGNRTEPVVTVFHAEMKGATASGSEFTVGINPALGNEKMVGYGTTFRVSKNRNVIAQVLDNAAAAFSDLAEIYELPAAHQLACRLRLSDCERPYTIDDLATLILSRQKDLIALGRELRDLTGTRKAVQATGGLEKLSAFLETAELFRQQKEAATELIATFRSAISRLHMFVCMELEKLRMSQST